MPELPETSRPTRVGIVGLGPMGRRHAQAVRRSRELKLVGATDVSPDAVQALRQEAPGTHFAPDLAALCALEPEVLVVATNGPSHHRLFVEACERGVRRFVLEKPMCVSLVEAREIDRIANETGARIVVNLPRRYSPFYRAMARDLDGALGDVRAFHAALGASGLACNGTHLFDLGLLLLGARPISVVGFLDDRGVPNPRGLQFHDPGGFGIVVLEGGRRLVLDLAEDFGIQGKYQVLGRYGRLVIDEICNRATLEARDSEGRDLPLSRVGTPLHSVGTDTAPDLDVVELGRLAIEDAAGTGPVTSSIENGRDALKLVISFHLSHRRGHEAIAWDRIEELSGDDVYSFT